MTDHEQKLIQFARETLLILERDEFWDDDTINDIGQAAADFGLSGVNENGKFRVKQIPMEEFPFTESTRVYFEIQSRGVDNPEKIWWNTGIVFDTLLETQRDVSRMKKEDEECSLPKREFRIVRVKRTKAYFEELSGVE